MKWTECGCEPKIAARSGVSRIDFCPLHGMAPELLEALKELVDASASTSRAAFAIALGHADTAIAKASAPNPLRALLGLEAPADALSRPAGPTNVR